MSCLQGTQRITDGEPTHHATRKAPQQERHEDGGGTLRLRARRPTNYAGRRHDGGGPQANHANNKQDESPQAGRRTHKNKSEGPAGKTTRAGRQNHPRQRKRPRHRPTTPPKEAQGRTVTVTGSARSATQRGAARTTDQQTATALTPAPLFPLPLLLLPPLLPLRSGIALRASARTETRATKGTYLHLAEDRQHLHLVGQDGRVDVRSRERNGGGHANLGGEGGGAGHDEVAAVLLDGGGGAVVRPLQAQEVPDGARNGGGDLKHT